MIEWLITPDLVAQQKCYQPEPGVYTVHQIPINKVSRVNYTTDKCPQGHWIGHEKVAHDVYVRHLAETMRTTPLPPAIGFESVGCYVAVDGNHRVCAARLLGIKTIPMLLKTKRGRS